MDGWKCEWDITQVWQKHPGLIKTKKNLSEDVKLYVSFYSDYNYFLKMNELSMQTREKQFRSYICRLG